VSVDQVAAEADRYVLGTGEAGADRLRILHRAYGPGTRRFLGLAGLKPGMRVADIGCGVGQVTVDLAQLVGPTGHVVGVDVSRAQLGQAHRLADQLQLANVSWVEASGGSTGLPSGSFDLVYCRFLLLHLVEPESALAEMHRLLRPGGILVCEDGDVTSAGSEPPSALGAFAELFGALGPTRQVDYTLGRRLYQMVITAGFASADIAFNQPAYARGEEKRLLELSVAEAGPALVEAGILAPQDLRNVLLSMTLAAMDEAVVAIMPRMAQVSAIKKAA
jgi:SAM-dependent methyltransferase